MSAPRWTLSGRFTRWLVIGTVALVTLCIGLGGWFVRGSMEREIEGLIGEEMEELAVFLRLSEETPASVEDFVVLLQEAHPSNPMGWRIWRGDELLGAYGDRRLVALLENAGLSAGNAEWLRTATRTSSPDYRTELAIDVSAQRAWLERYRNVGIVLIISLGVAALAVGSLLCRFVVGQLREIVEQIRGRHELDEGSIDAEGFPDEIRSVAEALGELLQRIRSESERAELLTAGTAHELRSPIQNLLGETELALLRGRSNEEYREVLRSHHEELRRLVRAVDNLVTLCSARHRREAVPLEKFHLAQELELRLAPEHERASARGITLEVSSRGDLSFSGDREAIVLAVRNLVGNAVDWAPADSRVEVRLEGDAGELRVTVEDQGPGVAPEHRERIFEPFFRGPTAREQRAGYGLGLALTRSAVESHGGEVSVGEARLGGGGAARGGAVWDSVASGVRFGVGGLG